MSRECGNNARFLIPSPDCQSSRSVVSSVILIPIVRRAWPCAHAHPACDIHAHMRVAQVRRQAAARHGCRLGRRRKWRGIIRTKKWEEGKGYRERESTERERERERASRRWRRRWRSCGSGAPVHLAHLRQGVCYAKQAQGARLNPPGGEAVRVSL